MSENTKIEWADHTFNPWEGCTKVSPACDHCYAEARNVRFAGGANWGPKAPRRRTSSANWKKPLRWNAEHYEGRPRARVFGGSLCDVFDNQVDPEWRRDYWQLIRATPDLDWLLLTKRPQNIKAMLPIDWEDEPEGYWPNVWLGTTVENQTEAERRIPHLLDVPAAKRFLSCEPLLGPVDLTDACNGHYFFDALSGRRWHDGDGVRPGRSESIARVDWVIVGGESGSGARMMQDDWALSLLHQCRRAKVPFFMKQMTKKAPIPPAMLIREFPEV